MSKSHSLFGICGGNVYAFQSVIGTGTLQLVDDIEEKKIGLNALMKQTTQHSEWSYKDKMLEAVADFKLRKPLHYLIYVQKILQEGEGTL